MLDITEIGPIVFGTGAFNTTYDKDGYKEDISVVFRRAFELGVKAIDTAALYGPSEVITGNALESLRNEYPRDAYFLCTKAGRWEDKSFDYSPSAIRRSFERSLSRLRTSYIDLLYIHDVEYKSENEGLEAIEEAFKLKDEGKVRFVGFSGYPVKYLAHFARLCQKKLRSVDAVLSYCNFTLQNSRLLDAAPEFRAAGVNIIFNASPLSMSLLRSGFTHDFHPASQALRAKADEVAQNLKREGIEIADIALQYSLQWPGPTVIGMRNVGEVEAAFRNLEKSKTTSSALQDRIKADFQGLYNETWDEGNIPGEAGVRFRAS